MRNKIVRVDSSSLTDESICLLKHQFNSIGINPIIIDNTIEILEPDKRRKKHRLIKKRRNRTHYSLTERGIDISIGWLRRDLCL